MARLYTITFGDGSTKLIQAEEEQVKAFNRAFGDFDNSGFYPADFEYMDDVAEDLISCAVGRDWKANIMDEYDSGNPNLRADVNAFLDTVGIEHV